MVIPVLLALAFTLLVPAFLLWALWRHPEASRFRWLLKALYTGGFLLYALLVNRWDWLGYYLRYVVVAMFVLAASTSYRAVPRTRSFGEEPRGRWAPNIPAVATTAFVGALPVWTASGYVYSDAPVRLAFPLTNGWFYVGQGGNSTIINHHNRVPPQQYAIDIVALNRLGLRARGVYPQALDRYAIYDAPVHSPCDGTVAIARDGLPDQIPPASDRENLAGNHVVIACHGVNVLLAHLRSGSIVVRHGQPVASGQQIATVGNSGNTTEPHLHVHAVRGGSSDPLRGEAVPLLFDGRFPVRNTTFQR